MDSDIFSTAIEGRSIVLQTATDVARFSFIVQDSISYLDLKLLQDSRISDFRSLCNSCRSRRLRNFVNTEEKCRKFFAPKRRLLYTLHLDLPKGRECSLKDPVVTESVHYVPCCISAHIAEITLTCGFHEKNLSNFIEDALSINFPKDKLLKWVVKIPFWEVPLLSRLEIRTASKFIECFYPEVTDSALLNRFIVQFDVIEWMEEHEKPEILEYLLYHARLCGNIKIEDEHEIELISHCIYCHHYLNIGPILKYISDSTPTYDNYEDYLFKISSER
ncbi:hypothetical protein AVEN_227313-1 [Araneus ventricosus]|uniref:SOCS box domain-containing protein n=1 Tax=Araneus ventricosus TaxID=182803 RepID=A0A4Y2TAZ7_ARAVE|nr:hypothetical protein AVEN_227313-1 [Araneus ventricosus]